MDLKTFDFSKATDVDIAFPTFNTIPELLEEAKARGFYNGNTPYNDLFNQLFFKGGKMNFKPKLDEQFKVSAARYLKVFMGSFAPSHEEKEAISALILSELVDIEEKS